MRSFLVCVVLAAAAQAATINTTLTINNAALTFGLSSTLAGPCTLSGIGNCNFTATVSTGASGNFSGPYTITVTSTGDTITGTVNVPATVLGGSGNASASVSGGTGAYVNATGSFPSLAGSGGSAGGNITVSLTGAGTIVTGGPPAPVVTGVLDAASYTSNIAQGSIFVVKGTNMSAAGFFQTSYPLPATFQGVTITFTAASGGAGTNAFIVNLYNMGGVNQLAAIAPSSLAAGNYNLTVTNNSGITSAAFVVTIVARKADLVTQDSTGNGLAVMQNYVSAAQLDINRFTTQTVYGFTVSPAKPGQTEIMYVVGMGAVPGGTDNTASPGYDFTQHGVTVAVKVGGVSITPTYAGRAPGLTGIDQVDFVLPANIPTGCEVQVQLVVNGTASLATTFMAIAPDANSSSCVQSGFTTAQLTNFDQGAVITQGSFNITQFAQNTPGVGNVKVDMSEGAWTVYTGFELPSIPISVANINTSSLIGTCQVTQINSGQGGALGLIPAGGINLDAGKLTLSGPSGSNLTNTPYTESSAYAYSLNIGYEGASVPPGSGFGNGIIVPGAYTMAAAGGNDVKAVSVSLNLSPLTVTGGLPGTVTRGSGLTLNWTGGNAGDLVEISGETVMLPAGGGETGASFVCFTTADQKTFTVPASILNQLQAVSAAAETAGTASGSLTITSLTSTTFTATRVADGSSIPSTLGGLTGSQASSVVYQ